MKKTFHFVVSSTLCTKHSDEEMAEILPKVAHEKKCKTPHNEPNKNRLTDKESLKSLDANVPGDEGIETSVTHGTKVG